MLLPTPHVAKRSTRLIKHSTRARRLATGTLPRYRLTARIFDEGEPRKLLVDDADNTEITARVSEVLTRYGDPALAGSPAETVASRWLARGFTDAEEIDDWLAARCFRPERAHELDRAGLTPEQTRLRTSAGRGDYEDTVAYKFAEGDLSLEEARRIVTSDFWNS
jgi:hypothetical protein